ncbi:MAG: NlpC/P60 family protein [Pelotomaculum sp.]|jgi:cell wall-associated NlpC family hydrolase
MQLNNKGSITLLATIIGLLILTGYQLNDPSLQRPADIKGLTAEQGGADMPVELNWGAVNVPATVLWSAPGALRDYDELMLREHNDPAGWSSGMDPDMRLWLVGKAETVAIYGEPVYILKRSGPWLRVAAREQKTRLNENGYPGWVPASHIAVSGTYLNETEGLPRVVVCTKTASIYLDTALTQKKGEAPYQTRLPLLEEKNSVLAVRLPDGNTGYLSGSDAKNERDLIFSRAGIVSEAKQFLDLPYLWAGASSYGFDCSGFVMRLYQSQGISIPRDADDQALAGTAVARDNLLPGDLVFFATLKGTGQIHHVGMYIGDGQMIHAPNSTAAVRIDNLAGSHYAEEYWGARRYAP